MGPQWSEIVKRTRGKFSEKIWAKNFFWVLRFFSLKKKFGIFLAEKNRFFSNFFYKNKTKWYQKNAGKGHIRHRNPPNMCRNDSQRTFETKKNLCDFGLFSEKFTFPILEDRCFDENCKVKYLQLQSSLEAVTIPLYSTLEYFKMAKRKYLEILSFWDMVILK